MRDHHICAPSWLLSGRSAIVGADQLSADLDLASPHRELSVLRVLPTYRVMEGSRPKVYYPLSIRRRAISAGKTRLSAYSNLR
jgi:hypothetical protein